MSADGYKDRLATAKWTYREGKQSKPGNERFKKDRVSSRADKRASRLPVKRDIASEAAQCAEDNLFWDVGE